MPMPRSILSAATFAFCAVVAAQSTYDARILEYTGLRYACEGSGTPVLKIQNAGSATMGTCVVETWKNGLMVNSFNWVLAVPALTGEVRQPQLPAVPSLSPGDELEFRIISVNGQPDEDAVGNQLAVPMDATVTEAGTYLVHLAGGTGSAPDQLSWAITADNGQVVAQGGPYSVEASIDAWVMLQPEACHMVRFFEAGPMPSGDGVLSVLSNGTEVITLAPGTLGAPALAGLTTGLVMGAARDDGQLQISVYPNPAQGSVSVSWSGASMGRAALRSASGRLVLDVPVRNGGLLDLSGHGAGLYALELQLEEGGVRYSRIVLVD